MDTNFSALSALHQKAQSPTLGAPSSEQPRNPKEAAAQFEKVLVRQFVDAMTKDMLSTSLSGDDGPSWMSSQRDSQRDTMTDVLTDHIVESGALDLRELLLRRWGVSDDEAASTPDASPLPTGVSEG